MTSPTPPPAGQSAIPADQRWFWTPEWQAGEREADEALATDATQVFNSTEEFLAWLDAMCAPAATTGGEPA
jgi:hypothetical protein